MNGWVVIVGDCYVCGRTFTFNALHVPSVRIDPETNMPLDINPRPGREERARREPICRDCIERANELSIERTGEPLVVVHRDAYEASPEHELSE